MEIWGITGVIGSGKSTAIQYLEERGCPSIDADKVSRLVVDRKTEIGKRGFTAIYKAFGSEVLTNLGDLDRGKLRMRMMRNPADRQLLETILHPLITEYIQNTLRKFKEEGALIAFVEGSRLVESGYHNTLAGIIIVTADEKKRVKRVMERDSMGKDEVTMMSNLQDGLLMKRLSKHEWKNNGKKEALYKVIEEFLTERGFE